MTRRERRTLQGLRQEIRVRGVAVAHGCLCVPGPAGRDRHVRTSYTLGLTRCQGHPELICAHLPEEDAESVLRSAAHAIRSGARLAPGWGFRVGLPDVDERSFSLIAVDLPEHLWLAQALYGPGSQALQVVPADDQGLLPWESGIGTELLLGMPPAA